ncbi:NAD(P)-dependent alcohol dehydrogenase [Chitinophaga pinensis]|uniref:Alcohol dehydrogenase GroES domain protein n=1 Tax=Chitinophaga pinensis (strain ATCC 43595 / DSM 2588 / LMG 13176 / NBRC 15968 / NCIMB 11800 / UQM 2034) TaxID=485918 RepID=A0A979G6U5_CHIPD|nr:NAD(P)-dependent alcohol dehydrogenase [Chitinophaga pinensis]ACU61796.1 Alcohol dehydrogenase GroES domain protein [Chitinophaga pinensis DSM 2588]
MKKVIYQQFGNENVLEIVEAAVPTPEKDQLLVRVKAVSINPLDWKVYRGEMKLMSGSKFPKTLGIDFSGIVESIGSDITGFKAGDEVIGLVDVFKGGALADYVLVKATDLAPKPANISFEQAAALPVTGLSALQIIDELAAIRKGQEVLINGATGGIGLYAIQIAKKRGARVTAVAGTQGTALAKTGGADQVIDYTREDIRNTHQRFDTIIDLSTKMSFTAAKKLMKKKATFVTTLPSPLVLLQSVFNNLFSGKKLKVLILKPTAEKLNILSELAKKDLKIVLDKTYSFNEIRSAYKEAGKGKIIGKSVIVTD